MYYAGEPGESEKKLLAANNTHQTKSVLTIRESYHCYYYFKPRMCATVHVHSPALCICNISDTGDAIQLLVVSTARAHASALQNADGVLPTHPRDARGHPF